MSRIPLSATRISDSFKPFSLICLNIDPGQFALIDVDDLDTTGSQRAKQLLLDPRLYGLADLGRAAAKVE
jgi:hypothetical protein